MIEIAVIEIEITNRQSKHAADESRLMEAARRVLIRAGLHTGTLSIAVVDDPEIHVVNRRHLNHDYPTDVISFLYDADPAAFDGELIVSADTAATAARRAGWPLADELLLYVIHGTLHLVGFDDQDPASLAAMRQAERELLASFGLTPPESPLLPGGS